LAVQQGRCWACHVAGPPERKTNFLCGVCAHPDLIRTFCGNCRDRASFDPDTTVEAIAKYFPAGYVTGAGTVIRLSRCHKCTPKSIMLMLPLEGEVYKID
jgi:hypothetical protein